MPVRHRNDYDGSRNYLVQNKTLTELKNGLIQSFTFCFSFEVPRVESKQSRARVSALMFLLYIAYREA
jgi:hypothetical protein